MTTKLTIPARLQALFDVVCDEIATEDQLLELEKLVESDEQARSTYLAYCQLQVDLHFAVRGQRAHEVVREAIWAQPKEPSIPPVPGLSGTLWHGTVNLFSSGWPLAYLIATVIFTTGILVAAFTYVSQPEQVASMHSTLPSSLDGLLPARVGRVTATADCQWIKDSVPLHVDDAVPVGREVKLESGLLEITYDTGARVILQGPATYEVASRAGGFLSVGKLTARIAKKSNPRSLIPNPLFVVRTPSTTVTDLGTEFGVEVDQEGVTETNVFVGAVRVARIGGKDAADQRATVIRAGQFARVEAGQQASVSVGQFRTDAMATRFVRAMPEKSSMADDYAKLVLSMKPVAYYRMERPKDKKDGLVVFDSAPGGHHGTLHPGYDTEDWLKHMRRPGRFGDAVHLYGRDIADYVEVRDFPNADTDQISVSAWVYATRATDKWPKIVGEETYWRSGDIWRAGEWRFCMGLDEHDGNLEGGIGQRDKKRVHTRERQPFPVNQWQHVALVADGRVSHLYRNGIEVAAMPCNGINRVPPLKRLLIGCQNDATASDPPEIVRPNCLWPGRIDELAIFYHALSAEQVRQLCEGRGKEVDGP